MIGAGGRYGQALPQPTTGRPGGGGVEIWAGTGRGVTRGLWRPLRRSPRQRRARGRPTAAQAVAGLSLRDTKSMRALPMMTPSARLSHVCRLLRCGDAEADGEGRGRAGAEAGDQLGPLRRPPAAARFRDTGHCHAVDEGGRGRGDEGRGARPCWWAWPWALRGLRRGRRPGRRGRRLRRRGSPPARQPDPAAGPGITSASTPADAARAKNACHHRRVPCSGKSAARTARRCCARRPAPARPPG